MKKSGDGNRSFFRDRLEQALGNISHPDGEGRRACLTVYGEEARIAASAADRRRTDGREFGPLDGCIVSIKDLFDVAGEATRAGSPALEARSRPARRDAVSVQRLRVAGALIVAKTNMSEFAFSGVGLNPHFGTPGNPADRNRVPGGSSSGAAVSVADDYCDIAIGTDTGGSVRIPAALCGLVGFKPTQDQVPLDGTHPLSHSFDSIGPIARTVDQCALAYSALSGHDYSVANFPTLRGLRLGAVQGLPQEGIDQTVGKAYEGVLRKLSAAGVIVTDQPVPELNAMVELNRLGGIVPAEAYFIHRELLETDASEIDPNIGRRLEIGSRIGAADYLQMLHRRRELIAEMKRRMQHLDALVMPTTPIVAPTFEEVATPEGFHERNVLLLRNTAIANFFGLASITVPIAGAHLPVGLMLTVGAGEDERLLSMAHTVEALLHDSPRTHTETEETV